MSIIVRKMDRYELIEMKICMSVSQTIRPYMFGEVDCLNVVVITRLT